MSKGSVPVAMHEKAEMKKKSLDTTFIIIPGIYHARQCYITKQTVEPDGKVELEIRCLHSSARLSTWRDVQANLFSGSSLFLRINKYQFSPRRSGGRNKVL